MKRRLRKSPWSTLFARSAAAFTRQAVAAGTRALVRSLEPAKARHRPGVTARARARARAGAGAGAGVWTAGVAMGAAGTRRYRMYRPPHMGFGERLPLLVMLHGCGQDAHGFAASTRMNRIADRERFLVLYPEQQRLANAQGCWNWFDTASGRAQGEAALILQAIDQACLLHAADRARVAVAGLSAGASMAALLVALHPGRFKAVAMHSGIPPGTAHSPLSALGAMHGRRTTQPLPAAPVAKALAQGWPPLLVIHGAADGVVAPRNGQAAARVWADATGASAGTASSQQRGQRYPMTVTDFKAGGRTVARLVEVARLGHAWSGGAASQPYSDPQGPDASRMVWAFVAKQFGP